MIARCLVSENVHSSFSSGNVFQRFGSIAEDGNLLENVHSTPDESTLNNGSDEDEVCATVLSDDGSELLLKTNVPSVRIST